MEDLDAFIEQEGLGAVANLLRERALPCFNLHVDAGSPEAAGTRLGGRPCLPEYTPWPTGPQGPLPFLAQFDLADLASQFGPTDLPSSGLLSFFSELQDVYPPDATHTVVIHTPSAESGRLLDPPEGLRVFNPVGVRVERGITLPVDELFFEEALASGAPDLSLLALGERFGSSGSRGQLLGHAITSQDDLQACVVLAALGHPTKEGLLFWDTPEKWESAKQMAHTLANGTIYRPWSPQDDETVRWMQQNRQRIAQELCDWQLLFRLDSNREMDLWVNDADSLFLFMRRDKLRAGDFTQVMAVAAQS